MNVAKQLTIFILSILFFPGCTDTILIPKPPSYLRLELPEHISKEYNDDCPYSFSIHKLYNVKSVSDQNGMTCHKDIDLGPLNGSIHFSYIEMEEPLAAYVNFVNDKVDEHKVKATAINDTKFLNPVNNVYCTFFELEGDVASPFQFYLTDSISNFASGVVYFNSAPNYDSLKPSLDYLKVDLKNFINSFKWKK